MSFTLEAFGPVAYPLLMCSFLGVMLVLERVMFFIMWRADGNFDHLDSIERATELVKKAPPISRSGKGVSLLLQHQHEPRILREEIMNHWMSAERTELFRHFGWFVLLAVISPMLGLLGTVLGIIQVFSAIANHTGPVSPALLADGLGQAMLTTAAGMVIALPILVAMHSLRIWANQRLTSLAQTLNAMNLLVDGIRVNNVVADDLYTTKNTFWIEAR